MNTRPNILWMCTDQQRWDTLGCSGNSFVQTPNLDHLAQTGVVFESAYAQSPICTPSRASFLTGRYPRTTRTRQNGQSIPADETLITKRLADVGYICGLAGKLHVSASHPSVSPVRERRIDDGYAVFHWSHHPALAPGESNWPLNEYHLWLREQGLHYQSAPFKGSQYVQVGPPAEHHQTTWCAEQAITFIEAGAAWNRPWLFSVNFYDPHHPFDPPEEYLQRYLENLQDIPLPNYVPGELNNKPPFQHIDHQGAYGGSLFAFDHMTEYDHRLMRAAYWAMCNLIDEQVGRILSALERTDQLNNTLVIFMSDHGEMLGDHGIYLKGPYFYEPAIRVPLLVAQPGVIPGSRRSTALVELVDVAPTLLDAALGADAQPQRSGIQGRSLWPLLTGRVELNQHRDDVYSEYYNAMPVHKNPAAYATAVRTDRYKLVAMHGTQPGELYDLENDAHETHNRWDDQAFASIKCELLRRLCDRMAWTVDPLPEREANW